MARSTHESPLRVVIGWAVQTGKGNGERPSTSLHQPSTPAFFSFLNSRKSNPKGKRDSKSSEQEKRAKEQPKKETGIGKTDRLDARRNIDWYAPKPSREESFNATKQHQHASAPWAQIDGSGCVVANTDVPSNADSDPSSHCHASRTRQEDVPLRRAAVARKLPSWLQNLVDKPTIELLRRCYLAVCIFVLRSACHPFRSACLSAEPTRDSWLEA